MFGRETSVDGASIDSRTIGDGQLFVPIVADRDGHDFIGAALAGGAAAYLTNGPIEAATVVRCEDTSQALTARAPGTNPGLAGEVIGVTGSVGKTSLKDLLRSVAGTTWSTHAGIGSFNNEMGVPLTLLGSPDGTEVTVVEMGARGIGHIADLCTVARPTVGVVTVVAGAHMEQVQSLAVVAMAKGELVEAIPESGLAVLNADDELVAAMVARSQARVLTFGRIRGEVRAERVRLGDDLRARFHLASPWGDATVQMAVAGEHQITNALGAAVAALGLGAEPEAVAEGLARAVLSGGRMHLRTAPDGTRVLDDSYNANPTSMAAALRALAASQPNVGWRCWAPWPNWLGLAEADHEATGMLAQELGLEVISVAEPRYANVEVAAPDVAGAAAAVRSHGPTGPDTAVLVKASRSAGLERVVALLLEH